MVPNFGNTDTQPQLFDSASQPYTVDSFRQPFIHVLDGERVRIYRSHFGPEGWSAKDMIVLGALDDVGQHFASDVVIKECTFKGIKRQAVPNEAFFTATAPPVAKTDAQDVTWKERADLTWRSVVRVAGRVTGLRIYGCLVAQHEFFLLESAVEPKAHASSMMSGGNVIEHASIDVLTALNYLDSDSDLAAAYEGNVFPQGGRGFELRGSAAGRLSHRLYDPSRPSRNLLQRSEAVIGASSAPWSPEKAISASSPPSEALAELSGSPVDAVWIIGPPIGDMLTVIKQAVTLPLSPDTQAVGCVVFSAWLAMSGAQDVGDCYIAVVARNATGVAVGGAAKRVRLDGHWSRYSLLLEKFDGSSDLIVSVTRVDGAIAMLWPQLELGDSPTAPMPSPDTGLRALRRYQGQSVGTGLLQTTSAPPVSAEGYREGDRLYSIQPDGPTAWALAVVDGQSKWIELSKDA